MSCFAVFFWRDALTAAVVLTGLLFCQWYLHHLGRKRIASFPFSFTLRRRIQWVLTAAFCLANAPWLYVLGLWLVGLFTGNGIPHRAVERAVDVLPSVIAYPFSLWHWSSLAGLVVSLTVRGGSIAWTRFRRLTFRPSQAVNDPPVPDAEPPLASLPYGRREFIQAASVALTTSPFFVSSYGAYVAREGYRIEKKRVVMPGLPPELRGTTIVQLTDIHAGVFMDHRRMMDYVQVANNLDPDLIVLTGDYVPHTNRFVHLFLGAFKHLRARHGVYATIGNHDLFTGSVPDLLEGLHKHNIRLLINEQQSVEIRGKKLNLIGLTFITSKPVAGYDNLTFNEAMRGLAVHDTTILLSHQPDVFPKAAALNIPLTLSGHTHGGQVKFEFLGQDIAPSRLTTSFTEGIYRFGDAQLYVSRGLGTSGPPVRLGAVPEITHLTLV